MSRGLWRSVVVAGCLAAAAALLTGSTAAVGAARRPFRVLQMNLCDSGLAGCYTGRSVPKAAALLRSYAPDLVTLNEVCRDDVEVLGRALAEAHPGDVVVRAFQAAGDRRTAGDFRCRNGEPYGIGLLMRLPAGHGGYTTYAGRYPTQDEADPEVRAWLCLHAAAAFYACTTHLASTSPAIALAQCAYLLHTAIPALRSGGGPGFTVLGGDLNLSATGTPDVRSCVPPGYLRADDTAVQQVMATAEAGLGSSTVITMDDTTDHPSLLVLLAVTVPV